METEAEILVRPAIPPEVEAARWLGFEPGTTTLPAGSTYSEGGRSLTSDIVFERDVEIPLSDGTVIYADIFRPVAEEAVPAIVAWSPYGKQGGFFHLDMFPNRVGVPPEAVSSLQKFEGPDPAYWCAHGYAVVNVDSRGAFASGGDIQFWSAQEGQDGYDSVEWVAARAWCADAVVLSGNSWLGAAQWIIAATRPPSLKAIAPWEGLTDPYRDMCLWGGIPDDVNPDSLIGFGRQGREDVPGMMAAHPFFDAYWRGKVPDIEAIEVPAYVVASWTGAFHVRGTLEAFTRLDKSRSWLRVHNTHEWPDLYQYEDDLLRFYDHVVKGADNGWLDTPRVRVSVLDPGGKDIVDRPEVDYPLPRAVERTFYLDASAGGLVDERPKDASSTSYDAEDGTVDFRVTFSDDTELTGPLSLRVHVSTNIGDDLDLYAYVRKVDADGNVLLSHYVPGLDMPGNKGQLRASHRELDEQASTSLVPVQKHERSLPLEAEQIVQLDIAIRPLGMFWRTGEQLQLLLSARNLQPAEMHVSGIVPDVPFHSGTPAAGRKAIQVHTGGDFDSRLIVSHVSGDPR